MLSLKYRLAQKIVNTLGLRLVKEKNYKKLASRPEVKEVIKPQLNRAVIVDVSGGLCNQMMCYKAARYLTENANKSLIIGSSSYLDFQQRANTHWNFQLNFYPIRYDLIALGPVVLQACLNCNDILDLRDARFFQEMDLREVIHLAQTAPRVLIDINFALELWRAMDDIQVPTETRNELTLDQNKYSSVEDDRILDQIRRCPNPVAIHVRRGDFLDSQNDLSIKPEYYVTAINCLSQILRDPLFFIFSDDHQWIGEIIGTKPNIRFVDHNPVHRGFVDLYIASRCKHFVLTGHSTYSHHMVEMNDAHTDRIVISNSISDLVTKRNLTGYFVPQYCQAVRNGRLEGHH